MGGWWWVVFIRTGGSAGPVLLLIHGLAANAEVWRGLIDLAEQHWPGRWIAPDLRGHGRSACASSYSYGGYAADLAELLDGAAPVTVLGHSMGGAVGLALASGSSGVSVGRVIGVGIKVGWTDDEAARMLAQAARQSAVFPDRDQAVARCLRLAGLEGPMEASSPVADAGVVPTADGFQVAFDPAVNGVGRPPMQELVAAARAEVRLACGESDPMVTVDQLRELDSDAVEIPGLGHNAHVEDPDLLWQTLIAAP